VNKNYDFKINDEVLVLSLNKPGVIVSRFKNKNSFIIQIENFKIKSHIKNLKIIENKSNLNETKNLFVKKTCWHGVNLEISDSIDLHGKTVKEAIFELEQFIEEALFNKVFEVKIIHGKGTGILKKTIHTFLKKNKLIKNFRLGMYGEGDFGITVVEIIDLTKI
jgi:DNA mismatch repair protein MutS2